MSDTFTVLCNGNKGRLECDVFERWVQEGSGSCYCGTSTSATVTKTTAQATREMQSIEGTLESSIGLSGIVQLKSAVKATLGTDITWTRSRSFQISFPISAPKCGRADLTIYQLIRDYELTFFKQGGPLYRSDVWVQKWSHEVSQETDTWTGIPEWVKEDERCDCPKVVEPAYDGRVSVDFGKLTLLCPYRLSNTGIEIRVADHVISFPFLDRPAAIAALAVGSAVEFEARFIPHQFRELGQLEEGSLTPFVTLLDGTTGSVKPLRKRSSVLGVSMQASLRSGISSKG